MVHAYLITAYNNFDQLKMLLMALDHKDNRLYVHMDKKSRDFNPEAFQGVTKAAPLTFIPRIGVNWGGYSFIRSELMLIEAALKGGADYLHLISGTDIPLKEQAVIHAFFEAHKGKEFIEFEDGKPIASEQDLKRVRYYHLLLDWKKGRSKAYRTWDYRLLRYQKRFGINRIAGAEAEFYKGSGWYSITADFGRWLMENRKPLRKRFKFGHVCDELYIQTMVMLSPFKDNIYDRMGGVGSNMRLVDWERGNGNNPYTYRLSDYEALKASPYFFARKLDSTVDKAIVTKLYKDLNVTI